jgi:hypothetical protein
VEGYFGPAEEQIAASLFGSMSEQHDGVEAMAVY